MNAQLNPTLMDLAAVMDPNGAVARVIDVLSENNIIVSQLPMLEGNLVNGHQTTISTAEPSGSWRRINLGVKAEKGADAQITFACGHLETFSEMDEKLYEMGNKGAAFRAKEDRKFIRGLGKTIANTVFYGRQSGAGDPGSFDGLSYYYRSLTAENKDYIIDAGGTGTDNASIWVLCLGENEIHGIYPKGMSAPRAGRSEAEAIGVSVKDLGRQLNYVSGGKDDLDRRLVTLVTQYKVQMGLVVNDYRCGVRICNIDRSNLSVMSDADFARSSTSKVNLQDLLADATNRIEGDGRMIICMDRVTRGFLIRQLLASKTPYLGWSDVGGMRGLPPGLKRIPDFQGVPILSTDALNVSEARVQ